MEEDVRKEYEKIKDVMSEEDFLKELEEKKKNYEDVDFMDDIDLARLITGKYIDEKNEGIVSGDNIKIGDLEAGQDHVTVIGRVMSVANTKSFKTRKGKDGKLCNVQLADDTGQKKVVFWTQNIPLLKNVSEGDVIQINDVDVKEGFNNADEIHLQPRSTINKKNPDDYPDFPEYKEDITDIGSISLDDNKVNIIGRIIRKGRVNTFERDGREGKVTSLELQDGTGKIQYSLWNKDVDLIDTLELDVGDSIKVLNAVVRENRNEIALTHRNSKIIKGDFDVPEMEETLFKIGDAEEKNDVT